MDYRNGIAETEGSARKTSSYPVLIAAFVILATTVGLVIVGSSDAGDDAGPVVTSPPQPAESRPTTTLTVTARTNMTLANGPDTVQSERERQPTAYSGFATLDYR